MAGADEGAVVVTGGSSGIGRACAEFLAHRMGRHVLISGTDAARVDQAARSIGGEGMVLDLSSKVSVERFVTWVEQRGPVGTLICNAGIQLNDRRFTGDGIEETFATNYLGHVRLIRDLLGGLTRPARIVLVTSGAHDPNVWSGMAAPMISTVRECAYPLDDGEPEVEAAQRSYTTSKLCAILATYSLARQLEPEGVSVNAFDPGLVPGTRASRYASRWTRVLWGTGYRGLVVLPGASTIRQAGRRLGQVSAGLDYADITGAYFSGGHRASSSHLSYDNELQDRVWRESLQLVDDIDASSS